MTYFIRTEDGTTTNVTKEVALAEANRCMMDGKREVAEMTAVTDYYMIWYKDGRKVTLSRQAGDMPAEEAEEWGTATASMLAHKFHGGGPAVQGADYRAKCNKRIRWYARPLAQSKGPRLRTRSEIESVTFESGECMYRFCPRCEAR